MTSTFPLQAIRVTTTEFEFSHGKKPRGAGSWGFFIEKQLFFFPMVATFTEAVKLAKLQAQQMGATVVSVAP